MQGYDIPKDRFPAVLGFLDAMEQRESWRHTAPTEQCVTEINRIHLVLFGMQNGTFVPCWQPLMGSTFNLGTSSTAGGRSWRRWASSE
jgi:hypothetical protein